MSACFAGRSHACCDSRMRIFGTALPVHDSGDGSVRFDRDSAPVRPGIPISRSSLRRGQRRSFSRHRGRARSAWDCRPRPSGPCGSSEFGRTRTLKTNSGRIRYKRVLLPEARLGGITFRNLACDQVNADSVSVVRGRGIMGLALLRRFNVLIDYRDSRLAVVEAGAFSGGFRFLCHGSGFRSPIILTG